ncbi:MAG: SDR family oxidoreductase [Lysobacterales bacterium]|nr:MAG: SDR family oxidoreductase [Xanthomonadales bacterium]
MATFAITGAARGIGFELCRQLRGRGERVVAICRRPESELQALGCRVVDGIDVAEDGSVTRLARELSGERIDVLVNNAGILSRETLDDLDLDRIRRQFEVNALGPLRVTRALLPNLGAGAKVIIVTSRMGSMADNGSGGYYGYRMSKAAVNMAGVSLARDLAPRGIAVGLLHPGMVATEMTGREGIPVEEAARNLIARIDELEPTQSGSFRHANGEPLPW